MRVIGYGNRERGDDGVGPLLADQLRELGVEAEAYSGDPLGLIDLWEKDDDVLLIDAVVTGSAVGTVHMWDGFQRFPIGIFPASSHELDLAQIIELARAVDRLPRRLYICGIEAHDFSMGKAVGKQVRTGAAILVNAIQTGTLPDLPEDCS